MTARDDELERLRSEVLQARKEADQARADGERLLSQVRDANERLVIAAMRSDELADELAQHAEAREQFVGIVGHDLRNPLTAIMLSAGVLGSLAEPYRTTAKHIAASALRMESIIEDLLDFTRGRLGGGIPVSKAACDVGQLCARVVEEMRRAFPGHAIACEAPAGLVADCDQDRMEQVLSNLVGNAITHGADPIRVTACLEGDEVVVAVHDAGPPIPAGSISTLFEPFARGMREGSLGLGLYIVSEIVRAHGGAVTVASAAGEGTTFTLRWPSRSAGAA